MGSNDAGFGMSSPVERESDLARENQSLRARLARLRDAAKETRDACAALFQFVAENGTGVEATEYLLLKGVQEGFGVRVEAAIAESEVE